MERLFVITLFVLLSAMHAFAQKRIAVKDAAYHIGQKVTVCDKVLNTLLDVKTRTTLLIIGNESTRQYVTIIIKDADRKNFKYKPENYFRGRDVTVTGKLVEYNNKPGILINDPSQIKLELVDNPTLRPFKVQLK